MPGVYVSGLVLDFGSGPGFWLLAESVDLVLGIVEFGCWPSLVVGVGRGSGCWQRYGVCIVQERGPYFGQLGNWSSVAVWSLHYAGTWSVFLAPQLTVFGAMFGLSRDLAIPNCDCRCRA